MHVTHYIFYSLLFLILFLLSSASSLALIHDVYSEGVLSSLLCSLDVSISPGYTSGIVLF